jgi:hypothetical protein
MPKRKKNKIPMTIVRLPFLRIKVASRVILAMKRARFSFAAYVNSTTDKFGATMSGAKMQRAEIPVPMNRRTATPKAERIFAVRIECLLRGYAKIVCIVPFSRSFPIPVATFFRKSMTRMKSGRPIREYVIKKTKSCSVAPDPDPPKLANTKLLKTNREARNSGIGNL